MKLSFRIIHTDETEASLVIGMNIWLCVRHLSRTLLIFLLKLGTGLSESRHRNIKWR